MIRICIGIITCKRVKSLSRLLNSMKKLGQFQVPETDIFVVVVDNDEKASSREIVIEIAKNFPCAVQWVREQRRGIPFARNRVVACAFDAKADFLAFIDDDEQPEPQWLDELLRVQRQFDADVVLGPVLPRFEQKPPSWVIRGNFFKRPRFGTGTKTLAGGTGNVLFRVGSLKAIDRSSPFEESLALTGGSDAFLLQKMHGQGMNIVWANEAVVYESIPASRTTKRWLLQRAWRTGIMRAHTEKMSTTGLNGIPKTLARGGWQTMSSLAALPWAFFFGLHFGMRVLRRLVYGSGEIAGIFGARHQEYEKIHGG